MQQGSKSGDAIRFCEDKDISVVAGECILMFAEPADRVLSPHDRWVRGHRGELSE